ncbi:MAG: TRAP transporter substrate-binding protein [Spirochaetia bacterium]|nr:TRAP transporter substrate-binding protein [Spirochaetia bacterium]
MKKAKVFAAAALLVAFALAPVFSQGQQGEAGDGTIEIKLAHDNAVSTPAHKAFLEFKKILEEETEGRISVKIFPGGQMGSVSDTFEQVRRGDIQMSAAATTLLTQTIPEFMVWDLFYLFDNAEHAHKVLDGKAGEELMKPLERFDIKGLGYMEIGFRNFSNSKRPIEEVEDLQGLKIRGYSPMQIKAWSAAGCNLTTLSWTEVFTSLQQNLIDGQECATTSFYNARFYEAQEYWSLTQHIYTNFLWYVNQRFWDGLSEEDQNIIADAAERTIDLDRDFVAQQEAEVLGKLEEAGVKINEVPIPTKRELGDLMNSAIENEIIETAGKDVYELVMEEVVAER